MAQVNRSLVINLCHAHNCIIQVLQFLLLMHFLIGNAYCFYVNIFNVNTISPFLHSPSHRTSSNRRCPIKYTHRVNEVLHWCPTLSRALHGWELEFVDFFFLRFSGDSNHCESMVGIGQPLSNNGMFDVRSHYQALHVESRTDFWLKSNLEDEVFKEGLSLCLESCSW